MRERIKLKDGSSFPVVDYQNNDELVWRAHHTTLSTYDKHRLGSIAQAYMRLIELPLKDSNKKLSMIKKALKEAP
jgi:hypothetical protein